VVGWDSLRYFWKARTPDSAARDLDRIIRHYLRQWGKSRVVAVGYSLGAETMPFIVNRLSPDTREKVALTALLAPGPEAFFEFHVSLWLGREHGGLPLGPELRRLAGSNLLCVYGADESDSSCAGLTDPAFHIVRLPGGHHFDGDYEALGRYILEQFVRK
jgi:type IV secretory pathway VirJ component